MCHRGGWVLAETRCFFEAPKRGQNDEISYVVIKYEISDLLLTIILPNMVTIGPLVIEWRSFKQDMFFVSDSKRDAELRSAP